MSNKRHFQFVAISMLIALMLCVTVKSYAQEENAAEHHKIDTVYCGWSAHVDIASPFMGLIVDRSIRTLEAAIDVNLFNKIFPIAEIGYGQINSISKGGSHFQTAAPYWRIGLNYNIMRRFDNDDKPRPMHNYPFVGLRYGMSVLNYKLTDIPVSDPYWGGTQSVDYTGKNIYAGWLELLAGVRVDVAKGFTMGWAIRMKMLSHASIQKELLWYVPGCGRTDGLSFSFTYTLGFTARTAAERKKVETQKAKERAQEHVTIKQK